MLTEIDQLQDALFALQKLEKKLRQLANRGDAGAADLADAKAALALVRAIYARNRIPATDLSSRAERKRRHDG